MQPGPARARANRPMLVSADAEREVGEALGDCRDALSPMERREPARRDARLAVHGAGQSAGNGADGAGVAAHVDGRADAVLERGGVQDGPQGGLQGVEHEGGAAELLRLGDERVGEHSAHAAVLLVEGGGDGGHLLAQVAVDRRRDEVVEGRARPACEEVEVGQRRLAVGELMSRLGVGVVAQPDRRAADDTAVAGRGAAEDLEGAPRGQVPVRSGAIAEQRCANREAHMAGLALEPETVAFDDVLRVETSDVGQALGETEHHLGRVDGLAESLADVGGFDPEDIIERYRLWFESQPRHVSLTVRATLLSYRSGTHWDLASRRAFEILGGPTAGNGSIIRCAPVGLRYYADAETRHELSHRESTLTHFDLLAGWSCAAFNDLVTAAIHGDLREQVPAIAATLDEEDRRVSTMLTDTLVAEPEELRSSSFVLDTLQTALWTVLHATTFEHGVCAAVNLSLIH